MLQEPGLLTKEIVDTWVKDLTIIGVWDPVNRTRLPVCQCDYKNMMMSGKAMINSCTEGLQLLLKEGLKPKDRNGSKVFFIILQKVYSASISKMRRLKEELGALDLKKVPAKNVMVHCSGCNASSERDQEELHDSSSDPRTHHHFSSRLRKCTCPFLVYGRMSHDDKTPMSHTHSARTPTKFSDPLTT
jgi:hypothetical protein